jgi:hypothetical protein
MPDHVTAADVAAVRRVWQAGKLTDGDVGRLIDNLATLVAQRDEATERVRRLAETWPRVPLKQVEVWLAETAPTQRFGA